MSDSEIAKIAALVVTMIKEPSNELLKIHLKKPIFICQADAYSVYGEMNIRNLVSAGLLKRLKRKRKIEYRIIDIEKHIFKQTIEI